MFSQIRMMFAIKQSIITFAPIVMFMSIIFPNFDIKSIIFPDFGQAPFPKLLDKALNFGTYGISKQPRLKSRHSLCCWYTQCMDCDEELDQNLDFLLRLICQHQCLLEEFAHMRCVPKFQILARMVWYIYPQISSFLLMLYIPVNKNSAI